MERDSVRTRNSRWDDAPAQDADGRPKLAALTARDIAGIFAPLARHRYLPADYLYAFAGGNLDYLIARLNLLARRPNLYLRRPHQQRANAGANHRRLIYELADKAIDVLRDRGVTCDRVRVPASFAHELMVCQVMASLELGARETGMRLIAWSEILGSPSFPNSTRHSPKPSHIPVSTIVDGQRYDTHVAADGYPFGAQRTDGAGSAYFFCPGIEADCATEPIAASDFARSSIYKKLVLYLAIEAHGIHRTHFGFPNFYVPVITTTAARARSMMEMLRRITSNAGSKIFLFKTYPAFTSFEKPRPPSGHMLTEDWQRVGHPPFNFLTS